METRTISQMFLDRHGDKGLSATLSVFENSLLCRQGNLPLKPIRPNIIIIQSEIQDKEAYRSSANRGYASRNL